MKESLELLLFVGGIVLLTVYVMGKKGHLGGRRAARSTLAAGAYGAPSQAGGPGTHTPGATVPSQQGVRNRSARQGA